MSQSTIVVLRQIGAVLVSVYGVLTASVHQLHLPVAVSSVLVAFGPLILVIEHYVADPTTGSSTTTTPVEAKQTSPVPVQLVQQVAQPINPSNPVVQSANLATPVIVQAAPNPAPPAP